MAHASNTSVLGNFNDTSFDYFGTRSTFFRRDGRFLVNTDGADGQLATFEVKYTFGVFPLQQYLVEFPGGRLQALSIAWDARAAEDGGQRWFHLYPNEEIKHEDVLHWTKLNHNWNFMCAECHSTGLRKNYDAVRGTYDTKWAEISVGCEACHGRGSRHVAWAQNQNAWIALTKDDDPNKGLMVLFDERHEISWSIGRGSPNAHRSYSPPALRKEVETCGLCHARRGVIAEDWVPGRSLSQTHSIATISQRLFEADGQMTQEEVYNYVPFKQSRMFAAGVTCSDCHDPHSGKLKASGDAVCSQCHLGSVYASTQHTGHVDAKVSCVSCHMPERTYMLIDRRHDHSFRIPRPDVSAKLATPNACNSCHRDQSPEWAAAAIERWHGPVRKGLQTYADAFKAAWSGRADAGQLLAAIAGNLNLPAIARAGALREMRGQLNASDAALARKALVDADPMVRISAIEMLSGLPGSQLWPIVSPRLDDADRGVRIAAASLLASVPESQQPADGREKFSEAAAEFEAAQHLNADRPEGKSALANFYVQRGRFQEAETKYRAALRLSPQYMPAAINLADLLRQLRRDSEGEMVLRQAIQASPRDAGAHYALGLALVRLKRLTDALGELASALELEPDRARYAYVYAAALNSDGRKEDALTVLERGLQSHQDDRDLLMAAVTFKRESADPAGALLYAERLALLEPSSGEIAALVRGLREAVQKAGAK